MNPARQVVRALKNGVSLASRTRAVQCLVAETLRETTTTATLLLWPSWLTSVHTLVVVPVLLLLALTFLIALLLPIRVLSILSTPTIPSLRPDVFVSVLLI